MKITKIEVLALAKLLHNNMPLRLEAQNASTSVQMLFSLAERLDRFILTDEAETSDTDQLRESVAKKSDFDETNVVYAAELHDLPSVMSSDGAVEFENADERVDLLVDGLTRFEGVIAIRRYGRYLEVQDNRGSWYTFIVARYPKGWATHLPVAKLMRVVI